MKVQHASFGESWSAGKLVRTGLLAVLAVALVVFGGMTKIAVGEMWGNYRVSVLDETDVHVGEIEVQRLGEDGTLRLGFQRATGTDPKRQFEWWQLAQREDMPGYPRVDPQSGGSGLPGAKGEDEDPAYYSGADFADAEIRSLIWRDSTLWLLDRPTHDSGFLFESWLVERTGPESIVKLSGFSWGIHVNGGRIVELHHPQPITRRSWFDWHESLRISGFGSGWEIKSAYKTILP